MTRKLWPLATLVLIALAGRSAAGADELAEPVISTGDRIGESGYVALDPAIQDEAATSDEAEAAAELARKYGKVYPWASPTLTPFGREAALRLGWWAADQDGSEVKINEFQKVSPSPFWDVDGIFSDGRQTLDFSGSQLDEEANSARLYWYQPKMSVDVEFDRYFRALDHDPLYGAPNNIVTDDLNVGEDYAIRVQELKASAKGKLNDNIHWRLNVFGLRRSGERQANAIGHCFDLDPAPGQQANRCHLQSQRQRIDWLIMEINPVVEARFDNLSIEYSRTMRTLGQDDDSVTRTYTRFGYSPANGTGGPPYPYAFVPENDTQIDRLKISSEIFEDTHFYSNMFYGDTRNHDRGTDRTFGGVDLRLTNNSVDNVNITLYTKLMDTQNELPSVLLPEEGTGADMRHPIDYGQYRSGVKVRWTPFDDQQNSTLSGLAIVSGYEYFKLTRDYAVFSSSQIGTFSQPDTKRHQIEFGPTLKLGQTADTYVRYRGRFTEDPIIGVRESTGRFNTNQPEQEHGIDVGGTWMPQTNLMLMGQISMVNSWNDSRYPSNIADNRPINFSEDSYPITTSVWYAPTEKLSLSGGYSYFSNWIEQDISQGFRQSPVDTSLWDYQGTSHVVNFNANYAWTSALKLVGGWEWVRGNNSFNAPSSTTGADWSTLPTYSDVLVETNRILTGVDYEFRPGMACYFRYNLFDYDDKGAGYNSGTGNMFLAGATATY